MHKAKDLELNSLSNKYGREILIPQGENIFCTICKFEITIRRKYYIDRHCNSKKHTENVQRSSTSSNEAYTQSEFNEDLCNMMISANIPFKKLDNPHFRSFSGEIYEAT